MFVEWKQFLSACAKIAQILCNDSVLSGDIWRMRLKLRTDLRFWQNPVSFLVHQLILVSYQALREIYPSRMVVRYQCCSEVANLAGIALVSPLAGLLSHGESTPSGARLVL